MSSVTSIRNSLSVVVEGGPTSPVRCSTALVTSSETASDRGCRRSGRS